MTWLSGWSRQMPEADESGQSQNQQRDGRRCGRYRRCRDDVVNGELKGGAINVGRAHFGGIEGTVIIYKADEPAVRLRRVLRMPVLRR